MTPLEQIEGDLSWRESELGSLKILLSRDGITHAQRQVLLRASWAMLYAHYEGFVKTSLTIFYDEVQKRVSTCAHLPKMTKANALRQKISKLKSLAAGDFLDEIEEFEKKYHGMPPVFPEVDTKSNLWPNLLTELLVDANLDCASVKMHELQLKTLVGKRNDIAHGKPNVIAELEYYIQHENAVYDLMYDIAFQIDERLKNPPYIVP